MNNTKIQTGIRPKIQLAAAALSALVLLLALACEPEPNSGGAGTPAATPDTPLNLSLSGFDPHPSSGSDPNGEYALLNSTEVAALSFDLSLAPDGATTPQVDDTKPAYKKTAGSTTWYLWASVTPSRYNLSRANTGDIWYFENGPAPAFAQNVASWNKVHDGNATFSAQAVAEGTAVTAAQTNASVAIIPVSSVTLNNTTATIKIRFTAQLAATVEPANASYQKGVSWSSDRPDIATVDQKGEVLGVSEGTATITAASVENPAINAAATVTVTKVPVTAINFTAAPSTIGINERLPFTAAVTPTDASYPGITWSSSDTGIATVDQTGLVLGIAAGTATITAASVDDPAITKSADITVAKIFVNRITLDKQNAEAAVGQTVTLVASVAPANASYPDLTWSSSDETFATVDAQGIVTGIAPGTATITATSTDDTTKTASASITVYEPIKITAQPAAAYDETAQKLTFSVTFDAAVSVTPANNTGPQFAFTITRAGEPTKERTAAYKSGSGTATLVFEYARENYNYGDINYAADPIVLNGGTIQDAQKQSRPAALGGIAAQNAAATIASIEGGAGIAAGAPLPANIIFSASSSDSKSPPSEGRLNSGDAWIAANGDNRFPWWQVDFTTKRTITKIDVQGVGSNLHMEAVGIEYSNDGTTWTAYEENGNSSFAGPKSADEIKTISFSPRLEAQYLRVTAFKFYYQRLRGGTAGGRFEVYVIK